MAYYRKLEGRLCYLSPIDPDNYAIFATWVNDIESSLGMIFLSSIIGEQGEKEAMAKLRDGLNFAIVDSSTDKVIGTCGIPSIDERNRHCEVGIFIGDPEKRQKGYGTEAMSLLLEFAFSILNLHSVALRVYSFNKPAIRCYEKCGFKFAGSLRHAKRIGGSWYDELIMDILEDEFESRIVGPAIRKREDC